jgi:hypothetical protein
MVHVPPTDSSPDAFTDTDTAQLDATSAPFVGRWHRLVSTTNWEKGRIICQWRAAQRAAGAGAGEYSDEAWSQCVGGVSGQHVGRLRRVFERFGASSADYPGLFWSHFCAALDWNDAEMWLEGAVQNHWSVARMRQQRSTTLGEVAQSERDGDPSWANPLDDDAEAGQDAEPDSEVATSHREFFPAGPLHEGPDFGDDSDTTPERSARDAAPSAHADATTAPEGEETVRPFAALAELPDDLAEACEAFKLAILRHKLDSWRQIAADDVLACLAALQQLVLAK